MTLWPLLAYCGSLRWEWRWLWRSRWNVDWQGKPKCSEKTCPTATFFQHKIPHDHTRIWTRASSLGSRRLTAWAMAPATLGEVSVNFSGRGVAWSAQRIKYEERNVFILNKNSESKYTEIRLMNTQYGSKHVPSSLFKIFVSCRVERITALLGKLCPPFYNSFFYVSSIFFCLHRVVKVKCDTETINWWLEPCRDQLLLRVCIQQHATNVCNKLCAPSACALICLCL
jgi:hypothetical protein